MHNGNKRNLEGHRKSRWSAAPQMCDGWSPTPCRTLCGTAVKLSY